MAPAEPAPSAESLSSIKPQEAPSPTPAPAPPASPSTDTSTPSAAGQGAQSQPQAGPGAGMGTQRVLGLTSGIVGVAGLGLGVVFGLLTTSAWNRAKSACGGDPSQCLNVAAGQSDHNTAVTDSTVSTVAFVAGGALLATGALLLLTAPARTSAAAWTVVPGVAPGGASLAVSGAF